MRNGQIILVSCLLSLVSIGCSSFSTGPYSYAIAGDTISPESVIKASSEARNANISTDVDATERSVHLRLVEQCFKDYGPICASIGYNARYGGGMYMPYDYTTMGLLAIANQSGMNGQDGSDADASDARARADMALNKFLKHGLEHHNENQKEE